MRILWILICMSGCTRGTSPDRTGEFGFAAHTLVEGEVRGRNGVPLSGIVVTLSITPELQSKGFLSELSRSDGDGGFRGTIGRLLGMQRPAGTVEEVTGYLLAIASAPQYPLTADGKAIRDSAQVLLRLTAGDSPPLTTRVTIVLPLP
jgi:hypothetical protein